MKKQVLNVPKTIRFSVFALGAEALFLAVWAIVLMVYSFNDKDVSSASAIAIGVFYLIVATSLAITAKGILKASGAARSLAIVWQLFAVIIGVQSLLSGVIISFIAVILSGLILILLFTKSSLSYFAKGI